MWVDSHCHLIGPAYDTDEAAVLARARLAGIEHFLTIACDLDEITALVSFASQHEDVSMTVGVHPHEASKTLQTMSVDHLFSRLQAAAEHPKVVGLGEMGYDQYYQHSALNDQEAVLDAQLNLAYTLDLPVSIHTRDAEEKTLQHLRRYPSVRGVIHCFSGTNFLAKGALELGYYLSLSGIVTFSKADALRETLKIIPLESILLETDAPFLAPVPHRGKRNEPSFLINTAAVIAALKGVSLEELAEITTQNFYNLFSKIKRNKSSI